MNRNRPSAALVAAALLAVPACAPSEPDDPFQAGDPDVRVRAIQRAAAEDDREAIPELIEQLQAADALVRMVAISTLERLTGETYGYRHYAPLAERRDAVRRWVEAWESGALAVTDPDAAHARSAPDA